MEFNIKEGAIFISDSHENENRHYLLEFLKAIKCGQISASQIFFMGDIFDYLSCTTYVKDFYKEQILLINEVSQTTPCFYFEGNHDFNLSEIFPYLTLFPIEMQPVKFALLRTQTAELAHGDKFIPFLTARILLIFRNKIFLKIMDFIDKIFAFRISKSILNSQKKKNLNRKIQNFKDLIGAKIHNYSADFVIEGHYHQDEILHFENSQYINLNSFAVEQKIYRVTFRDGEFEMVLENLNLK